MFWPRDLLTCMCTLRMDHSDWCTLYCDSDGLEEESQLLFGDSEDQDGVAMEDTGQRAEHVLWVDKYSPRHFTDLLSDDVRRCSI